MCVCEWRLAACGREGGREGRRVGGIFAYHQSRERECNEERMCVCWVYVCIRSGADGLG